MAFGNITLTNAGRAALSNAIASGTAVSFAAVMVGEGRFSGSYASRSGLVAPVMTVPVSSVRVRDGIVEVDADWNSLDAPKGFYYREVGLIGADGVLYYYDNAGEDAEWIDPDSGGVVQSYRERIAVATSSEASVTPYLASGLYVAQGSGPALTLSVTDGGIFRIAYDDGT